MMTVGFQPKEFSHCGSNFLSIPPLPPWQRSNIHEFSQGLLSFCCCLKLEKYIFLIGLCIPTDLIYTVYIHTYIMCIYRDLYAHSQDCWQGNAESYLWLALLLSSAKSSSPMLRWGCNLSWKLVSFAVSFPSLLDLYLTESACFCTLQMSANEVIKLW